MKCFKYLFFKKVISHIDHCHLIFLTLNTHKNEPTEPPQPKLQGFPITFFCPIPAKGVNQILAS